MSFGLKPPPSRNERFWQGLLPPTVAEHQAAYERRHAMLRAVQAGARPVDIARHLGMGRGNVYHKLNHAELDIRRNQPPPVIRYCGVNQVGGLVRSPQPETPSQTWHEKYVELPARRAAIKRREEQALLTGKLCGKCRMPLIQAAAGECWGGNGLECYWPVTVCAEGPRVAVERAQHLGHEAP